MQNKQLSSLKIMGWEPPTATREDKSNTPFGKRAIRVKKEMQGKNAGVYILKENHPPPTFLRSLSPPYFFESFLT